jgi:hypothetical protein
MDEAGPEGTTAIAFRTKDQAGVAHEASIGPDFGRGRPGKPVGADVAAARVLRRLHGSERPLNASDVSGASGLHRGIAYNIIGPVAVTGAAADPDGRGSFA